MHPRALIVEDDSKTREALRSIIESEGFAVETTDNGETALECLSATHYSLVILDIVLPKLSGTSVMEHLQSNDPEVLKNVIVVSGLEVEEIRKLFPTVYHAMGKPVLPGRLRTIVRKHLTHGGTASAVAS